MLGRHGVFLASLAAMSLLTIASHHHEYRSHNAVTFHHSRVVERQLPAPAHHVVHGNHGTRVTVRNLFGNMPVRVKQRSIVAAQRVETERLCEGLKHAIVGLLLSWHGTVSVRVRDSDNKVLLNLSTSDSSAPARVQNNTDKPRSSQLGFLLNILTQANYITIDEWPSWVPVSASTSTVSVKGAISLDPAPSRHVQFISVGLRPLSSDCGRNELFDHVNRLFANSTFGMVEEEAVDEHEKIRRLSDKRFKNDGYTNQRRKARKDVDRYPMFHLRVLLAEADQLGMSEDQFLGDGANLQNIMDIVEAMITQWLTTHHFQPRQPRKRRDGPIVASGTLDRVSERNASPSHVSTSQLAVSKTSTAAMPRKRKRSNDSTSCENPERQRRGAFAEWSRIKSGKSEFFSSLPARPKSISQMGLSEHTRAVIQDSTRNDAFVPFATNPIAQGAFSAETSQDGLPAAGIASAEEKENDDSILWTDPSSGKIHVLNARTGCIMPHAQSRPNADPCVPIFGANHRRVSKSIRLPSRASTAAAGDTPWLNQVLRDWENPVFKPSEQRIQQTSISDDRLGREYDIKHSCSRITDNAFDANATSGSSRFSKENLQNAQVISQVDKKFILVKMQNALAGRDQQGELLVLIDQHAADERVQVESLLAQLCTPLPSTAKSYQSKLGHTCRIETVVLESPLSFSISAHEHSHFCTHAARFAAWGILYDVSACQGPTARKQEYLVSISTLPPAISQRCVTDPKILISLLRSTVWSYVEDTHVAPLPRDCFAETECEGSTWVSRLSTCPPALVNLINSRACRSAVMFNDELSQGECEQLVRNLAACSFPFMCAHGRPSMVPLVDLGQSGRAGCGLGGQDGDADEKSFVRAWRKWRV